MAVRNKQLIWLGVGSASQPVVDFERYDSVILVEAQEEVCAQLRNQVIPNAQVINAVVTVSGAETEFITYNLSEFSACTAVSGLKTLFPGLKITQKDWVSSTPISELIDNLQLQGNDNILILDIPDLAFSILQQLAEHSQLQQFTAITVSYGVLPLYQNMPELAELQHLLQQYYFTDSAIDNSDPDLPVISFTFDAAAKAQVELALANEQQKVEITELNKNLAITQQRLQEQYLQLENTQAIVQKLEQEQKSSQQVNAELLKQIATLEQQVIASEQLVEQNQKKANHEHTAVSAELAETQEKLVKVQGWFEGKKKQALELEQQLQQLQLLQQQRATETEHAAQVEEALKQQLATLQQQAERAQQQREADQQQAEQTIDGLNQQLTAVSAELAETQETLVKVQGWFEGKKKQALELEQQLQQLQQQQAAETEHANQVESELKQQLATLEQQAERAQQQREAHQQHAEQTIDGLNQQLSAVSAELSETQEKLVKVQGWFEGKKKQALELEQQLQHLQQQRATETEHAAQVEEALKQQLATLQQQAERAQQQREADQQQAEQTIDGLNQQLIAVNTELAETQEKLVKVQGWFESRKKQATELEQQLLVANTEIELLKAQQVTQDTMQQLQASMQQMFANQAMQLQQATNALGQHITRSQFEQQTNLQHYLGLQQYLQTGEPVLSPDSWAIPADTLAELVKLLNTNNYDVIIEFGSGQSTTVIAKTLAHQNAELQQVVQSNRLAHKGRKPAATEITTEHYVKDLPARIVSFEQAETYLHKTQQQLNEHGVAQFVELVLAPLVPANYVKELEVEPLFYSCTNKLAEIAGLLTNRQARILVLVDGPTSPTNDPLVRYAALPVVLNHLAAHKLQIVLDDSKRDGEQQVLNHWLQLCKQRGLRAQLTQWPTQKGAIVLDITP